MNKYESRARRGRKTKFIIKDRFDKSRPRLVVFRSNANITAQIVKPGKYGDIVLASCSTVETSLKKKIKGNKVEQASLIGKHLAERAIKNGIEKVVFDRSGYQYHGRVKAIADGAREAGLII